MQTTTTMPILLQTFTRLPAGERSASFPIRLPERNTVYQTNLRHLRIGAAREEIEYRAKLELTIDGVIFGHMQFSSLYANDVTVSKLADRLVDHCKKLKDKMTPLTRTPVIRYLPLERRFELSLPSGMAIFTTDANFFEHAIGLDGQSHRRIVVDSTGNPQDVYGYWNPRPPDLAAEVATLTVRSRHQMPLAALLRELLPQGAAVVASPKISAQMLEGAVDLPFVEEVGGGGGAAGNGNKGLISGQNLLGYLESSIARGLEELGLPEGAIKVSEENEDHEMKIVLKGGHYKDCKYKLSLVLSDELASYTNVKGPLEFDLSNVDGSSHEIVPDKDPADATTPMYPLTVYADGGCGAPSNSYVRGLGFRPVVGLLLSSEEMVPAGEFRLDTDYAPLTLYFSGKNHKIVTFPTDVIIYIVLELTPSPVV